MNTVVMSSALALLAFGAMSCSLEEDPVTVAERDVVAVRVASGAFDPAEITVKVGQTVRFAWVGGSHSVVSGTSCTPDGRFRSGAPQAGGTFEHKFETPGSYPYYCEPHCAEGMTGEIVVEP